MAYYDVGGSQRHKYINIEGTAAAAAVSITLH